ncbi:MAG: TrbC/VirB2 family protein [Clostridia bacterium]|nr:TrbC/VirB2 family protein [Clostridia bacterium]MDD4375174.1 TrbC/VirB2 family protein [Clostridia bacterium]
MKNKMIIKHLAVIMIFSIIFLATPYMYATGTGIGTSIPSGGTASGNLTGAANKIWNTVAYIVQFLAIGAIVFAGVRYMFASADQKADIKKQTIVLVVGAILVFAAIPILKFVDSVITDIKLGT